MKKSFLIIAVIVIVLGLIAFMFTVLREDISGDGVQVGDFFPFLGGDTPPLGEIPPNETPIGEIPDIETPGEERPLVQISDRPISGFTIIEGGIGTSTLPLSIRFMEQETGHIYSWQKGEGRIRLSNTTIPGVYETIFSTQGDKFLFRYFSNETGNIETFSGEIVPGETTGSVDGSFFPKNITAVTRSGDRLFYLTETENSVIGTTSNFPGTDKKDIFTHSFREWVPLWWGNTILLTSKPSDGVLGYAYTLSLSGNTLTKILGQILGLTTLPGPHAEKLLYGQNVGSTYSLSVLDTKTGESFTPSLSTLPEKCVWASSFRIFCAVPETGTGAGMPDRWYQGLVSFSDQIWLIDLENGSTSFVASPLALIRAPLDIVDLKISSSGNFLFFINKKDNTLWALDLSPEEN